MVVDPFLRIDSVHSVADRLILATFALVSSLVDLGLIGVGLIDLSKAGEGFVSHDDNHPVVHCGIVENIQAGEHCY